MARRRVGTKRTKKALVAFTEREWSRIVDAAARDLQKPAAWIRAAALREAGHNRKGWTP